MHASIDSTFSTGDVGADLLSNGTARVRLGDVTVFLHAPADADALIAAAAEAKRLLSPPAITESCGVEIQAIRDDGDDCWVCTEDDGHAGDHIAKDIYDREVHRWPMAAHPDNAPEAGQ